MSKRATETALASLAGLRANPASPEARRELARHLAGRSSFVAAKAAQIAGDFEIRELLPNLADAFRRFLADPVKTDPGCAAKTAIAKALAAMEHSGEELFLQGIRHVQKEPSYGGPVDTAAGLRGECAFGLVRMRHPGALVEIVNLLVDPEAAARAAAVKVIGYAGRPEGALLLRLKVLQGDVAEVMSECFSALLELQPEKSFSFVTGFLDAKDADTAEAAALALGGSRRAEALPPLKNRWEKSRSAEMRRTLLLAIAMIRQEEALEFLFHLLGTAKTEDAAGAVTALGLHRGDEKLRARLEAAVAQRADPALAALARRELG